MDMTDSNTVNILNQIRSMTAQAEGSHFNSVGSNQESFGLVLQNALSQVNDFTQSSDTLKTQYELGDPNVSLGEVMIASQKASLGFEAAITVRNKLVQAYQDIMNMSV